MKNKKGFTLIELLAVIVILSILLSISVVAINNIRKKQELENKQNVISSILTGAKQYDTEKGIDKITGVSVKELLEENYVDFDQNKYNYNDNSIKANYEICNNNLKRAFYVTIDKKTYNDCGCTIQDSDQDSAKLCSGDTGTNKVEDDDLN